MATAHDGMRERRFSLKQRKRLMPIWSKVVFAAVMTAALGACTVPTEPTATAFSRNVGPGSSVTGPNDGMGSPNAGDDSVPGVSAATSRSGGK